MKTAIVCDWLVTIGGAEKVLDEMIHCYPDADLFAVIDFIDQDDRYLLHHKQVQTTWLQKLPLIKKGYRYYLPLMPLAIEQLDLSDYDLIISSSHAVAKGVLTTPHQLHVSYVHSPMRYAWDLQHQYLQTSGFHKKITRYFARYLLHKLRLWDVNSSHRVDHFIANSKFIAKRILKTYRRSAQVIYPPIDLKTFTAHEQKESFYLTASRFVPYKKIDLIVESFRFFPQKKLIVIGDGPEAKQIKKKAPKNVEFLGFQPTSKLVHYLQHAKAFIFAAEEDFGLLPLEAQACGTPVLAYGKGGALETVQPLGCDQPTGLFFLQQSAHSICEAIQRFEKHHEQFTFKNCVENAARFSPESFRQQFKSFITSCHY